MSLIARVIREAYKRGYRVLADGRVFHARRHAYRKLTTTRVGRTVYYKFTVKYRRKSVSVPVHRFAGFVQFGERALRKGAMIRHRDGNSLNNCHDNFLLGNNRSNMLDLGREHLSMIAKRGNRRKLMRKKMA